MTRAAYNGHEALTFSDYLDVETGKTLHAVPGGVYDVAPASGHVVPEFPDPWFTAVQQEPEPAVVTATAGMTAEGALEPDPGPEPEPEHDPEEG